MCSDRPTRKPELPLAAPATYTPLQWMMPSNFVRLPLIFVSEMPVPHDQMPVC